MVTTTILTIHINKGKTPKQCVAAQLNYIMNPTKTNGGALISSHACMPETAVNEFMLYRQEYFENTGILAELKPKLTDLKHIRYNYEILERDSAPNSHQHVIPKDHHCDEHTSHHDDESR